MMNRDKVDPDIYNHKVNGENEQVEKAYPQGLTIYRISDRKVLWGFKDEVREAQIMALYREALINSRLDEDEYYEAVIGKK